MWWLLQCSFNQTTFIIFLRSGRRQEQLPFFDLRKVNLIGCDDVLSNIFQSQIHASHITCVTASSCLTFLAFDYHQFAEDDDHWKQSSKIHSKEGGPRWHQFCLIDLSMVVLAVEVTFVGILEKPSLAGTTRKLTPRGKSAQLTLNFYF